MDMLICFPVAIILQYTCIYKHHVLYLKYTQYFYNEDICIKKKRLDSFFLNIQKYTNNLNHRLSVLNINHRETCVRELLSMFKNIYCIISKGEEY